MKKKLWIFLLLAAGLGQPLVSAAQDEPAASPLPRYGVGVQFGTTGAGLAVSRQLRPSLTLRVGGSYFAYRKPFQLQTGEGGSVNLTPDLVLGIAQASVKWHPFRRSGAWHRSFFLTGGGGYTWHPSLGVTAQTKDKITFGGLEMSPENVGTIQAAVRWNNVLGYGGLGFGRSVPRKRVGFGVELGCYYLGSPNVELTYDGFLEATTLEQEIPKIEKNMRDYRFLPSLQFHVSYAIRR